MQFDADVIVIGAGPAGSRAAAQLAAGGYDVLLLERRPCLGEPVCCTGIISRDCLQRFEIDPALVSRAYSGAVLHSPGGTAFELRRPEFQAVAVDRARFDQAMAERAVAAGARLRLGVRATGLITRTDRVAVEAIETDLPVIYTARAAIIAAGLSPRLTQSIGLGKIKDAALGFQVAVEATRPLDVEIFLGQKIAPGFFGWLAPVAENRAHVGLIVRGRGDQNITYLLDLLRQQGKISAVTGPVACRPIPLSRLGRTYADRVLVVGDAAGQVKSTTGGGIFYGLLCADIAADTLVHAFDRGDLSASVLKEYERRWMAELGWDLRLGRFGRKIFERLSDHRLDALILKARDSGLLDRLLADDSVSYDRHGRAILKAAATLWPALLVP